MIIQNEPGVCHAISRTALPGLPFKDVDKDKLLSMIRRYSKLYFSKAFVADAFYQFQDVFRNPGSRGHAGSWPFGYLLTQVTN